MYLSKKVELFYCNVVVVLDLSSTTRYIQQNYFTDFVCPHFRNSKVTEIKCKAQSSIKKILLFLKFEKRNVFKSQ